MPITYPHRHNLSASGTCFLEGLVSRPPRSTAPANRAGYLAGVRCVGHASTVKRRAHRSLLAVRCRSRPCAPPCAPPAHARAPADAPRAPAHTVRPAPQDFSSQARASLITGATTKRYYRDAARGSLSGVHFRCCCRCYCRRCFRSGRPSTPSASRSNSCPPSNPRRARRRGPGLRAGCLRPLRR